MNLLSKTILGLLLINLVIIAIILFNLLEAYRENNLLYNKLNTFLSVKNSSSFPNDTIEKRYENPSSRHNEDFDNLLRGIDVSHWNGNIIEDVPQKDEIDFVICKATEGEKGIDADFRKNWRFLTDNGIKKGAYHFYIYSEDPLKQAIHFCNTVAEVKDQDFPLIIDIEEKSLDRRYIDHFKLRSDLLTFLAAVEDRTHRIPVIYSNYSFLEQYMQHNSFSKYPLWLAEYSHAEKPKIPKVWKNTGCMIWQKTDRYDIHSTDADFDILFESE